tara:strand:- start:67 stop:399 length:333 start_codon:yes stop_codon:yes gene_type:complete
MTTGYVSPGIYNKKKPKSREEAIQMMQAFYIKKVLTEPIFTKLDIFHDDDIDFIDASQNEMINDLIAEQMAQKLAEQDLLNFKKRFLPNYEDKKIMRDRIPINHATSSRR